jgi:hypothetical protein
VSKKFTLYICSALCYLFEEKARRPHWNFGNAQWFSDNKRQAAFTLYKRTEGDFKSLIGEVAEGTGLLREHHIMKEGLERYLDHGGIPVLRNDIVHFAMDRGEKLIREDALKEVRNAAHVLDETAPKKTDLEKGGPINPEVSFSAQEFYRVLELAAADTLPNGPSEYKKLKMRLGDKDISLWEWIDGEIAANVTNWPEWFAILNQQGSNKTAAQRPDKPRKGFGRYEKLKKAGAAVPTEFSAFNDRFHETAEILTQETLEFIKKAILYSLQRFENHPDYREAIERFQRIIFVDKISEIPEAMPLLDVWNPSKLAEEEIIPTVLDRINDEVGSIKNLSYPYDGAKPCFWNLALIVRVQVQLMKTYRDRISRLVAAAETHFQNFFCNEVLRANVLPLVRTTLNNADFLGSIALGEGSASWEGAGQIVRTAVDKFKGLDGVPGMALPNAQKTEATEESTAPVEEVSKPQPATQVKNGAKKPATPATPSAQGKPSPAQPAGQAKDGAKKPATPANPATQGKPASSKVPAPGVKPVVTPAKPKPSLDEAPPIEEEPMEDDTMKSPGPQAKKKDATPKSGSGGKESPIEEEFDEW